MLLFLSLGLDLRWQTRDDDGDYVVVDDADEVGLDCCCEFVGSVRTLAAWKGRRLMMLV